MQNPHTVIQPQGLAPHIQALRQSGLLESKGHQHFEPHITLVRRMLDVPVAVISLLETDRQVFAAHQGLPEIWADRGETPLTHSFCQYVVSEQDALRVVDANTHPILKHNLAIPDLGVVAYLGVPLRLPSGEVVGALAAIDGKPRNWTDKELADLQSIAAVVTDKISTYISEVSWRATFEQLREGIVLAELVRDPEGKVADWRYLQVNQAWGELVGLDPASVVGRTVREILPDIEDQWIDEFATVAETGKSIKFTRQVGSLNRWYDGYVQSTGGDSFIVMFMECTDRILAQNALSANQEFSNRRQAALIEIGDRLRTTHDVTTIVEIISEVLAGALGAARAGYGVVSPEDETIVVNADWHLEQLSSLQGLHHFRNYGTYIEDLKRGENVIIPDVTLDPKTRENAKALLDLGIRVLINIPLMKNHRLIGLVMVHFSEPRLFTKMEADFVRAVADRTHAAISQANAIAADKLRETEISHRLKNSMAMVQAIATQTLKGEDIRERREAFSGRLSALANAHDLLINRTWQAASLQDTIDATLLPHADEGRFSVEGPYVELDARQSLAISLAVHELATNAAKYGALRTEEGTIRIRWRIDNADSQKPEFHWTWEELGGPEVRQPDQKGFGSRLITRVLPTDFGGEVRIHYYLSGVVCELKCPAANLPQMRQGASNNEAVRQ